MIAAVALSGLVGLLVQIIVAGLIVWLLLWLLAYVGIPEPFNKVVRVIIVVVAVLWLINILLGLGGHAFVTF
jgi:hypothetical protein